ncbi:MAG: choice-of-anchor D domain-containing protein, partial [Verrucomicrobiae bacterium]|nr:choice-of-anchor D domain-containing protein [Verrucomicrobiae bacterium]
TPSAGGSRTAELQIASNDADENPFDLALSGAVTERPSDYESDGLFSLFSGSPSSNPVTMAPYSGGLIFYNSAGLWKSDGTFVGTELLRPKADLNMFAGYEFYESAGKIFFEAQNSATGKELWVWDLNEDQAEMVVDLRPGSSWGSLGIIGPAPGGILFTGNDGISGGELWYSDGTASGTVMLADLEAGAGSSFPRFVGEVANGTVFYANLSDIGQELWFTDGTAGNTYLVEDIRPGAADGIDGGSTFSSASDGNRTYFTGRKDDGVELWITDGTETGTYQVQDIRPGPASSLVDSLTIAGGVAYFSAIDATNGVELWRSDGSEVGTYLVKNIRAIGSSGPVQIVRVGSGVLFTADDGINGRELWHSDGTETGTQMVADLTGGPGSSTIEYLVGGDTKAYFWFDDGVSGKELHVWDGVTVSLIDDINPGSGDSLPDFPPVVVGDTLYAAAYDGGFTGREIWSSDGIAGGTSVFQDLGFAAPGGSGSHQGIGLGADLIFSATGGEGVELWKTDGTLSGTGLLKDIQPGPGDSSPQEFFLAGGEVYFSANDGTNGRELWKTDGTPAGTVLAADFDSGSGGSNPFPIVEHNGSLLVLADFSLYRVDVLSGVVEELSAGLNNNMVPRNIASFSYGGFVYFGGSAGNDIELWRTDGTVAGTSFFKQVQDSTSVGAGHPANFAEAGGVLYFNAYDDANGLELWKSDGTEAGTQIVADIRPGNLGGVNSPLITLGSEVFFESWEGDLWKSDGTGPGTVLVKEFDDISDSWLVFNGEIYFQATDGTGSYLWISDGTTAGTRKEEGFLVNQFGPVIDGWLYFSAYNDSSGRELWATDGERFEIVEELGPSHLHGVAQASPLIAVGNQLYFTGWNGESGITSTYGLRVIGPSTGTLTAGDLAVEHPTGKFLFNGVSSIDFGTVMEGVTQDKNLMLWNAGNADLSGVSASIAGAHAGDFSIITPPGGEPFVPGTSTGMSVRFSPSATGPRNAALRVISNDPDESPFEIALLGVGQPLMSAPTDLSLTSTTLAENAPAGTVVGLLTAVDSDADESFTYSLVSGTGDQDNALFSIVGDGLRSATVFDHEQQSSASVRIQVEDKFGLTYEEAFIVSISDDRGEDADGDGLIESIEEDTNGTSDLLADTDGDGEDDDVEVAGGSDPLDPFSIPSQGPAIADFLVQFGASPISPV